MSEGYIKLNRCAETEYLMEHHPFAFLLLTQIALRARRTFGHPDGREIGEAEIGDYWTAGIPGEQQYRTAKNILERRQHIKIIETCRTRKKPTTKLTTKKSTRGTLAKLLTSKVWDINLEKLNDEENDQTNDRPTTDQRPTNDEQESKESKEVKESSGNADIIPIHEAWKFDPSLRPQCLEILQNQSIHYRTCNTTVAELSDEDFAAAALSFFFGQQFGFADSDLRILRDREKFNLEIVFLGTFKLTRKRIQFTRKNKKLENPMGLLIDICRHDNLRNLRILPESEDWEGSGDEELKKILAN